MNVLGFDIETTGLEKNSDKVIELAFVLWNIEEKKPVNMGSYLLHAKEIPAKIERLTGITQNMLDMLGVAPEVAASEFQRHARHAHAYVAHNGITFDMPFMQRLFRIEGTQWFDLPVIDTRTDLSLPQEVSSRKMEDIAACYGVINPFAHRALTDTLVMLEILSLHDIPKTIDTVTNSPFVTITASRYPGEGFWAWKERKCYRRNARQVYADKEVEILREKAPSIQFDITPAIS